VNSAGEESWPQQIAVTLGAPNAGPVIGPVVISEIHYHPETNGDEFVELANLTPAPAPLYHTMYRTNTWKLGGIDFTFPTNVTLDANGLLLVVATNPAVFRARYNVPTNVMIFGPYAGQLQNDGENLELLAPDNPNTNEVPYVVMDAVRYNDRAPWPPAADGSGLSLQRVPATGYGNEPANWIAAAPTPGQPAGSGDSDADGVPDSWEQEHGTFVFISDAGDDPDQDGYTNLQEYQAGTDPHDRASVLQFVRITESQDGIHMQFQAGSNRTYSLLYKNSLGDAQWTKLANIPARQTGELVTITNAPGDGPRFYRLVAPAVP
jgi:hypothetical protein